MTVVTVVVTVETLAAVVMGLYGGGDGVLPVTVVVVMVLK